MPNTDVLKAALNKRWALPKPAQVEMLLHYAEMNKAMPCRLAGTCAEVIAEDDGYAAGTRHFENRAAVKVALAKVITR